MLSHGALVRPYSAGHCCAVSWHLLATAGIFWHSPLTSLPSSSLPSPPLLFSLLCATAQLLVQLENPLHLRLSLRILFSARKLIQIVALCNSFPASLSPPLLCFFLLLLLLLLLFALSHSASCPFHYLDLCPPSNGQREHFKALCYVYSV